MNPLKRLEVLNLLVTQPVTTAIQSYMLIDYLDWQFYGREKDEMEKCFRTNPANTYVYLAIKAKADADLVSLIESIRTEEKSFGNLPAEIVNKWDLVNHRDYISHPSTFKWNNSSMAEFAEQKLHYKQNKPKLIWEAKKSLENAINEQGGAIKNIVTPTCPLIFVDLVEIVWKHSLNDGLIPPSKNVIEQSLIDFFTKYFEQITTQQM